MPPKALTVWKNTVEVFTIACISFQTPAGDDDIVIERRVLDNYHLTISSNKMLCFTIDAGPDPNDARYNISLALRYKYMASTNTSRLEWQDSVWEETGKWISRIVHPNVTLWVEYQC